MANVAQQLLWLLDITRFFFAILFYTFACSHVFLFHFTRSHVTRLRVTSLHVTRLHATRFAKNIIFVALLG